MAVSHEEIRRAAALLRDGKLVAFPTETVYGLGANALDPAAIQRIYEAKGRPAASPLIVHVSSVAMARELAAEWPDTADRLAEHFWPGPLTLIVRKRPVIPDIVTAGLPSVGLRIPSHSVALELIREAGIPIAAPSANEFTKLSPTTAAHVRYGLGDRVDMILDGGATTVGIESTVLSLATTPPTLFRPGMISRDQIEDVIGPIAVGTSEQGNHASPGQHPVHYRPRTPLQVGTVPKKMRAAYLYRVSPSTLASKNVRMPLGAAEYGARLYDTLHQLDQGGWDLIVVEQVPEGSEWAGIVDRLRRASRPVR